MPLPAAGAPWPPPLLADPYATPYGRVDSILAGLGKWSAWYAGDGDKLAEMYRNDQPAIVRDRTAQYRGGVVGTIARWFWGQPSNPGEARTKLHVPIAADMCQASADLLFSDPPTVTVEDSRTNDRIAELLGDGFHAELAAAAEVSAALGGVYLRVGWDKRVGNAPFVSHIDADSAAPEFLWGRLFAVTFWRTLADDGATVVRHLERHETTADGTGIILHGLYQGTAISLGRPIPLPEHPETQPLGAVVDEAGVISTGSPGLAVAYVPNQTPQRRWRCHPLGRSLGRSDLDGVEPLMDSLDETYSSWMRDVRLGKGRVFIADSLLEDQGVGQGVMWNADREVYAPVNALVSRDGNGLPIQAQQFSIRVAEHQQTARQLVADILRTAGYSAQTFGEGGGDVAATATEITARQQRSFLTRDRKIRLWRPALVALVEKLLAVDAALFRSGVTPERPTVAFTDGVQDSPLALAQTAQALRTAEAASTETLVRMVHPDWEDEEVVDEVARIQDETGSAVPDMADAFTQPPELEPPAPPDDEA